MNKNPDLATKRYLIDNVSKHWENQYFRDGKWVETSRGSSGDIYKRLLELPSGSSEEDVASIIGHGGWTSNLCDLCNNDSQVLVCFDTIHAERSWIGICQTCLQTGIDLLSNGGGSI